MKQLLFILFVLGGTSAIYAQGFDPDCYFPRIGVEIDTVTGSAGFASSLTMIGDSSQGLISFFTDDTSQAQFIYSSGPIVDIHNLNVAKTWNINITHSILGNFRSPKYKDAFDPVTHRLYWSDENGDFDSSRYTEIRSSIQGNYYPEAGYGFDYFVMNPYVTKLTSDSLDDIVMMGYTKWKTLKEADDSTYIYVLHFKGESLFSTSGQIVLCDSILRYGRYHEDTARMIPVYRHGSKGDFIGDDRKGWISNDYSGNLFYFKNVNSFTLSDFLRSIRFDTLLSVWENPHLKRTDVYLEYSRRSLRAFPKQSWDRSEDYVGRFGTNDESEGGWLFFQGGPDFGKKRLLTDSADFVLRRPSVFGSDFNFAYYIDDCGDMTGTGNAVIKTVGVVGHGQGEDLYYVLGKAIDDNIDINISYPVDPSSPTLKVRANTDKLQDVLFSINNYKGTSLVPFSSSLCALHGTLDIPVRLNPKYSVDRITWSEGSLQCYPNPIDQKTTLTFENCTSGVMYMEVVSSIGVSVLREEIPDVDGLQQYAADLSALPAGAYHIMLVCPADSWSAGTNVIKTGAAVASWSLDLRKAIGR